MRPTQPEWNEQLESAHLAAAPGAPTEVAGIVIWLSRLARAHESVVARLNEEHDLLRSETGVLMVLWMAGPPTGVRPSILASAMEQTTGGMTATLRRLESAGLVERMADPTDGRVSLARLTEEGTRIGLASYAGMCDWYEETLSEIDPERRTEILGAVTELFTAVERRRRRDARDRR